MKTKANNLDPLCPSDNSFPIYVLMPARIWVSNLDNEQGFSILPQYGDSIWVPRKLIEDDILQILDRDEPTAPLITLDSLLELNHG